MKINIVKLFLQRVVRERRYILPIVFCAVVVLLYPDASFALEVKLEVPFIGDGGEKVGGLADYLSRVYQLILMAIGVVATVMIMVHGIQWSLAAGNSEIVGSAKQGILNAIIGIVLAFLAYLILYTINTQLVSFAEPVLPNPTVVEDAVVDEAIADTSTAFTTCEAEQGKKLKDFKTGIIDNTLYKGVMQMNGTSRPCISEDGYNMLLAIAKELSNPSSPYFGMMVTINSAYRSTAHQSLLHQCYQKGCGQKLENGTVCKSCNKAAEPGTSLHESGDAIDVTWSPKPGRTTAFKSTAGYASSTYHKNCVVPGTTAPVASGCSVDIYQSIVVLDSFMQSKGFKRLCIEWWHFQTSSSGTCAPGNYR